MQVVACGMHLCQLVQRLCQLAYRFRQLVQRFYQLVQRFCQLVQMLTRGVLRLEVYLRFVQHALQHLNACAGRKSSDQLVQLCFCYAKVV